VCQQLDLEYDQALEERQIVWTARYQSVRQSTVLSIFAMIFLISSGTAFYYKQAEPYWTVPEALLFTIYTITTVGCVSLSFYAVVFLQCWLVCLFAIVALLCVCVDVWK
jgi:hypothetical protein